MERKRNRGFFIVWGSRNRITRKGGSIETTCPQCRNPATIEGKISQRWFTLYFIPIFPTGGGTRFSQCKRCNFQFRATIEEFQRVGSRVEVTFQSAIQLYNEMRETPADSQKLLRLLNMYRELNSPTEAISAGNAYPRALESSDACMAIIANAHAATKNAREALKWVTAALALNPSNTDAHKLQEKLLAAPPSDSPLQLNG